MTTSSISRIDSSTYWLALALTPQLGPARARRVVEQLGGAANLFHASLTSLEAAGLHAASAQAIFGGQALAAAEEEILRAASCGAQIIDIDHALYPPLLKQIYDPPVVLYVRGDAAVLAEPSIAVVGTRHPTPYGIGMAERLACDLAVRGLVITSGLARGVDTHGHRGALNGRGKTLAILGTGVDVIYPKENKKLADEIVAAGGAIVSEFAVGTFPAPQNFPIRNRIISGISVGVLVIEAGEYSGTRITARCALEQNREVFAVPGNVTNKNSWGPNTLIKQGAHLTATWEDVWESLPADIRLRLQSAASESNSSSAASLFSEPAGLDSGNVVPNGTGAAAASPGFSGLTNPGFVRSGYGQSSQQFSPHESAIFGLLKADESTHIDQLVEALEGKLSSSEIFSALFELELSGKIRQMPGKNYVRTF